MIDLKILNTPVNIRFRWRKSYHVKLVRSTNFRLARICCASIVRCVNDNHALAWAVFNILHCGWSEIQRAKKVWALLLICLKTENLRIYLVWWGYLHSLDENGFGQDLFSVKQLITTYLFRLCSTNCDSVRLAKNVWCLLICHLPHNRLISSDNFLSKTWAISDFVVDLNRDNPIESRSVNQSCKATWNTLRLRKVCWINGVYLQMKFTFVQTLFIKKFLWWLFKVQRVRKVWGLLLISYHNRIVNYSLPRKLLKIPLHNLHLVLTIIRGKEIVSHNFVWYGFHFRMNRNIFISFS